MNRRATARLAGASRRRLRNRNRAAGTGIGPMAMNNDSGNTHIVDALRRLRNGIEVPPVDPSRELSLLAAFDAHWARPNRRTGRWAWTIATAASVAIAVVLDWLVVRHVRQ